MIAIPIANLGIATISAQGTKNAQPEWFNPYPKILEDFDNQDSKIPDHVTQTFMELSREGKIPSWALGFVEND